ncbi:MAG: dGTP triphosphohydrolase [Bacteroidota bacterium]
MKWLNLLSFQRIGKTKSIAGNSDQIRSEFERDYDRIIFSQPFRSLQDKTQVLPLPEDDFVHTRLTHSLETASVGRSLGKMVGKVIVERHHLKEHNFSPLDFGSIVAAACLAHDVGNPPFGHSGEASISDFFKNDPSIKSIKENLNDAEWMDFTNFEGNAQGFRILNDNKRYGITPTFATLCAFTKYPRESLFTSNNPQEKRASQKKFGFFQSEKPDFEAIANEIGLLKREGLGLSYSRHPLAFLVEAADNICYHIIDLEDGCRLGYIPYATAEELIANILKDDFKPEKLKSYTTEEEKIAVLRAIVINRLIAEISEVFLDLDDELLSGSYDKDFFTELPSKKALDGIISVSIESYYRSRRVLEIEASGYEVLGGLLRAFVLAAHNVFFSENSTGRNKSVFKLLPKHIQLLSKDTPPYTLVQTCLDFITGLSDRASVSLYKKINGLELPGFS